MATKMTVSAVLAEAADELQAEFSTGNAILIRMLCTDLRDIPIERGQDTLLKKMAKGMPRSSSDSEVNLYMYLMILRLFAQSFRVAAASQRMAELEQRVGELDNRTMGDFRVGNVG